MQQQNRLTICLECKQTTFSRQVICPTCLAKFKADSLRQQRMLAMVLIGFLLVSGSLAGVALYLTVW